MFGPIDLMVNVTLVALAPEAIDGGLKVQLLLVSVGSVGLKLQLNVTGAINVCAFIGAALKAYCWLIWPARTVWDVAPVLLQVKSGAALP